MKKKLVAFGIASIAILTLSLTLSGKASEELKITTRVTQHLKAVPKWQKVPDCPVGYEGYICYFVIGNYPQCTDYNNWACVER